MPPPDHLIDDTPASQRLTNDDFRKLLQTPRVSSSGSSHPSGSIREAMTKSRFGISIGFLFSIKFKQLNITLVAVQHLGKHLNEPKLVEKRKISMLRLRNKKTPNLQSSQKNIATEHGNAVMMQTLIIKMLNQLAHLITHIALLLLTSSLELTQLSVVNK